MAVNYILRALQSSDVLCSSRLGYANERSAEKALEQLSAICTGIICDGVVNDVEARYFRDWLIQNAPAKPTPAYLDIIGRVGRIFQDAVIDDEERDELKSIMEQLRGGSDPLKRYPAGWCLDDPLPSIIFPAKNFVVTGNFAFGKRDEVYTAIQKRGGQILESVKFDVDYLIVGSVISKAWSEATFGNKIKAAVAMRERGGRPAIVPEHHWRNHLESATL